MPKWKISESFSATQWYVTFSADPSVTSYKIINTSYGRAGGTAAANSISVSNVRNDNGTTATFWAGGQSGLGARQPIKDILIAADQNAFVTVTWNGVQAGRLSVAYDVIRK